MSNDLVPKSFFSFPTLRSWIDDDDFTRPSGSGLTVAEDENSVTVEAHMPGLKTDDIEVTYQKGELWLRGERQEENEDKKKKYYRLASNSFSYRLMVPGNIDEKNEPEAEYKDGVMKVTFKKLPKELPKKISVKRG